MRWSNTDGNGLVSDILTRMENGFGRLEEGQKANRHASEMRYGELQRQITEHRAETRADYRELRSKLERSKLSRSTPGFMAILTALLSHWQGVLIVLGLLFSMTGLISPASYQKLVGLLK